MRTEEFQKALETLMAYSTDKNTAVMCAEAVPWRCHRSLIADALVIRSCDVRHIMTETKADLHKLTSFAHVNEGTLSYPKMTDPSSLF
jgi:uncharacterized protein (DUF488 family)